MTYKPIKEIIPGTGLYKYDRVDIFMQFSYADRTLITGIVKDPEGDLIPYAAVEVVLIDHSVIPNRIEVLGVAFTDEKGRYAVSVVSNQFYSYQLNVYSPLPYV